MSLNTNRDYWEDEIEETEKVVLSAIEMQEMIEQKMENRPTGGLLRVWKKEVNNMVDEYNISFGKIYKHVR